MNKIIFETEERSSSAYILLSALLITFAAVLQMFISVTPGLG